MVDLVNYRWIPNGLTCLRIVGAGLLLLAEPLSVPFMAVYTISGISDVLDGMMARLLKCTSETGARLDSISDMLFYAVMLVKLFPILWNQLPPVIWIWAGAGLSVRVASYLMAYRKFGVFASLHTWLNKLTGLLVFLIPYALPGDHAEYFCLGVCIVGILASLEELSMHAFADNYVPERKSLLAMKKTG